MMQQELDRNLFLYGEINDENTLYLIEEIKRINKQDDEYCNSLMSTAMDLQNLGVINVEYISEPQRQPIILEINSGGGAVPCGFGLISAIENSATPIIGYVTSDCCSMAIPILASCHYRMSTRFARFMIHELSASYGGKMGELRSFSTQLEELSENYSSVLSEYSNLSKSDVVEIFDKNIDYWFGVDEAKEYGIVDSVDNEGIEINEIMEKIYSKTDNEKIKEDKLSVGEVESNLNEDREEKLKIKPTKGDY